MLSAAFDAALRTRCAAHLTRFERRAVAPDGRRHAAVAAVILPGDDGRACFLLTKRMPKLRAHGGQWALPGGRVDTGESIEAAALRELAEDPVGEAGRGGGGAGRGRGAPPRPLEGRPRGAGALWCLPPRILLRGDQPLAGNTPPGRRGPPRTPAAPRPSLNASAVV